MIVINTPQIETEGDFVVISAEIEIKEVIEKLWYKFPVEFKKFLVTENVDAFLVGLLFLALKTGEDIHLKTQVSARLYYTLSHYLIPALCLANSKLYRINIFAEELNEADLNIGKIAGTGLSCGIDSFATYYDHLDEKGAYGIHFFTFLNAGSLGDFGGKNSRIVYHNKLLHVKKFAKEEDLEVIPIDTNLSEILKMNFQSTHTLRNLSCILNLQKLFKNYYYASPHRFDKFSLNSKDTGDYDLLNVSLLSTESINFFSSAANLTRIERTDSIANYSSTYNYLDVCTNPHQGGNIINCSRCNKCLRTALTLDLLGKLKLFEGVFDLKVYYRHKQAFIGKVLATKGEDQFAKEIYEFMIDSNQFSYLYYTHFINYKFKGIKNNIKRILKKNN